MAIFHHFPANWLGVEQQLPVLNINSPQAVELTVLVVQHIAMSEDQGNFSHGLAVLLGCCGSPDTTGYNDV